MTKLTVLSTTERQRFDSPPRLNADERALYFSLDPDELKIIQGLGGST